MSYSNANSSEKMARTKTARECFCELELSRIPKLILTVLSESSVVFLLVLQALRSFLSWTLSLLGI